MLSPDYDFLELTNDICSPTREAKRGDLDNHSRLTDRNVINSNESVDLNVDFPDI